MDSRKFDLRRGTEGTRRRPEGWRRARTWGLVAGAVLLASLATRGVWIPTVTPEILLATRGDFSREHAGLFRGVAHERDPNARYRFFDEVPHALELWREYNRVNRSGWNEVDRDREDARLKWSIRPVDTEGIERIGGLDARDYDLARRNVRIHEEPNVDALLALDFDRARREILARPPSREALAALVRWGVPRAEVEAAIPRLPPPPPGFVDREGIGVAEGLRIRLILDDQTLADPEAELRRRGLTVPARTYDPPRYLSDRQPKGSPFPAGQRLGLGMGVRARLSLATDPRDREARAFLRREAALPMSEVRTSALRALVTAGDPWAVALVARDLASPLGAVVARAITACNGRAGTGLLASPIVRDHRWPWVRLRAVVRLREIGPAAGPALALYRENACRDARRIARGETPFAVSRGVLLGVGSDPGHEVSSF